MPGADSDPAPDRHTDGLGGDVHSERISHTHLPTESGTAQSLQRSPGDIAASGLPETGHPAGLGWFHGADDR